MKRIASDRFPELGRFLGIMGIVGMLGVGTAHAGGLYEDESLKDTVPAGTQLEFSFNAGGTTDYVFRGFSQSDEEPAFFGGFDLTYGLFYAGVWASGIDFNTPGENVEIDFYGGITPSYNSVDFDFGVIYYHYPDQSSVNELDYVELKAGASSKIWNEITVGATFYYSPEFFGETGEALASEGSFSVSLPSVMGHTFELSGLIGYQEFFDVAGDYAYWNIGISKTFREHFTVDVRYWDTDVDGPISDERVVGTFTVAN